MGLKQDLIESITDAFDNDLADAVKSFSIRSSDRSFDPATGVPVNDVNALFATWRGVFSGYERIGLMNTSVKSADVTVISMSNEITFPPEIGFVIEHESYKYNIVDIEQDPTFSFVFMHCVNANYG